MSRRGIGSAVLVAGLATVVLWLAGAPEQVGALAGLQGGEAALGVLWIVLVPAVIVLVPALLLTAAFESLHAILQGWWGVSASSGVGSRADHGDTRRGE